MKGIRKLVLGLAYMAGVFGLSALAVVNGVSLHAVASVAGSTAAGLAVVIYGNVREHEAEAAAAADGALGG